MTRPRSLFALLSLTLATLIAALVVPALSSAERPAPEPERPGMGIERDAGMEPSPRPIQRQVRGERTPESREKRVRRDDGASPEPLAERLAAAAPHLDRPVLERALFAVDRAVAAGRKVANPHLTVIDFSLPSTEQRLWLFDLERGRLLRRELVAHGKNTGGKHATRFSNVEGSKQSSPGLFLTGETYFGGNGYSLRLHGLEQGLNDLALERLIVMHGAWYVSDEHVRKFGRLGRSWGCPALDERVAEDVIDTIKGGSLLFAYSDLGMEDSTLLAGYEPSRTDDDAAAVAAT